MYDFIDTTESQGVNRTLPSEALNFNGKYLEDEIPGYRTLYVTGREVLSAEITDTETGIADGSRYQRKRYPSRTIVVGYQLVAESNEAFRKAYNKLNALLDVEQAQMIFADELDKYYIGTKQNGGEVPHGRNTITSEIEFYCADPFKYSVKEYEAVQSADDGTIQVYYEGTYRTFPTFEINMNQGENGYIGLADARKHILQFGNIEETDEESYKENEILATLNDFFSAADDTENIDYMHPHYGAKGSLGEITWFNTRFLALKSAGAKIGSANGGLRTITLPADSQGNTDGCKNFYAYFHILFYAGLMGQTGEMCINFLTEDNKLICGVNWFKTDASGNTGNYELICYNPNQKPEDNQAGKILKSYSYTTSHLASQNPWYWNWGHCDIRKEGSRLTFFWWGSYPSFVVPEIENMKCAKIQIAIKQWGDRSGNKYLSYNGIDKFNFQKLQVEKWRDVPNKFSKDSSVTVKCADATVEMNGLPKPEIGAVNNDWEEFYLRPGRNKIQCICSSWAKRPEVKMKYREVYL